MKRIFNHFKKLIEPENSFFSSLKYYFMFKSQINAMLTKQFQGTYGLDDYKWNDKCAVIARIDFVERNEPRSFYNYVMT